VKIWVPNPRVSHMSTLDQWVMKKKRGDALETDKT